MFMKTKHLLAKEKLYLNVKNDHDDDNEEEDDEQYKSYKNTR